MNNKNNHPEESLKQLQNLKLSAASRERMEKTLREYAQFHGVRVGEESRSREYAPSRATIFTRFTKLNTKSMTAAIIVVVLALGGGTSYAAEGAVPGDFLYPVKTEVNENVKSALAFSSKAEAKLQARLVEERLQEAEELAARGELNAETAAAISARVNNHFTKANERNSAVEASGDFESAASVRASLEGSLRSHVDTLHRLNASVSGNDGASLISELRAYADTTARTQTQATTSIDASVDMSAVAEATIQAADEAIASVAAELEAAEAKLSQEVSARVSAKHNGAIAAHARAEAALEAGAHTEAYTHAQTAVRLAHEARTTLESMLRVNVRGGVNIDADSDDDGLLDVEVGGNNEETDAEADIESDQNTDQSEEEESGVGIDASVDVDVDAAAETNGSNTEVEGGASTRTNLRL